MNFAFPNAKVNWTSRPPVTEEQKRDKRIRAPRRRAAPVPPL